MIFDCQFKNIHFQAHTKKLLKEMSKYAKQAGNFYIPYTFFIVNYSKQNPSDFVYL